ncbi:MAG: SRPBCC family protein [Vicinamibacterales bacterium]
MIDLTVAIDIAASPAAIAAIMFDPQRYPEWLKAVQRVEVHSAALQPGARVTNHGVFMGQQISWTTEVVTVGFPHLLDLQVVDGPFVGRVRYSIQRSGEGSRVAIHDKGELTGIAKFAPLDMVTSAMRSAIEADLGRLKALVEQQ